MFKSPDSLIIAAPVGGKVNMLETRERLGPKYLWTEQVAGANPKNAWALAAPPAERTCFVKVPCDQASRGRN